MTSAHDEELRSLRARAYGRDGDIHLDADARDRLRMLERGDIQPDAATGEAVDLDELHDAPVDRSGVEPEPESASRRLLRWLASLRRSTVLIALGLAVVAAVSIVALVLVQRVQADPLQAGATEVARLALDGSCESSQFGVTTGGAGNADGSGFQVFHGLCAVVAPVGFLGERPGDPCLILSLAPSNSGESPGLQSALVGGGCAAGRFPARVQFRLSDKNLPAELLSAFPDYTSMQFVYDRARQEVVVFAST